MPPKLTTDCLECNHWLRQQRWNVDLHSMPNNFDDRMVRAYYCAHSGSLTTQLFHSIFTSSVSYDLRICATTPPTFDRKYWRQEAAFGCKYGGDAKIHILHAGRAHIGCHPQDMHMHTSELMSGRLQTCIHMPNKWCSSCCARYRPHTHGGITSLARCCVCRYPYSCKVPHWPLFLPAAVGTGTGVMLGRRFFHH